LLSRDILPVYLAWEWSIRATKTASRGRWIGFLRTKQAFLLPKKYAMNPPLSAGSCCFSRAF
jgi:hypothetical protein